MWHRRIAHIHMQHLNRIAYKELVIGLPKLKFEKDKICEACQKGKQTKTSFKQKQFVSTTRPLEMLHMDLFGPSRTMSKGGNYYGLVVVDDFSRYTWTLFLVTKDEVFSAFKKLAKVIQNEKNCTIAAIKTDHGREFQNENFVKSLEFSIIFQLQELHSKMGFWRGKIEPWKRLLELY